MSSFEYSEEDYPFAPDTRSEAEKWLDAEMDKRWAYEQGADFEAILRAVALDLFTEASALRATEQNLREELAAIKAQKAPA